MDCVHPINKRFTYRDAAAPLGREGREWCDECDQPVPPDHDDRMDVLAAEIALAEAEAEGFDKLTTLPELVEDLGLGGAEIIPIETLRARRQRQWEIEERDYIYAARDVAARAIKENTVSGYEDAADFLAELYDDCCAHQEIRTLSNDMRERAAAARLARRQRGDVARAIRSERDRDTLLASLIASLER